MKETLLVSMILVLAGCAQIAPKPVETAAPEPANSAPAPAIGGTGRTAEALDTTTEAERAAAVAAPTAAGRELGKVTVALGPPAEQGFWLRSTLVTAPGKGRVVTGAGESVAVDLLPGTGGALLSLAAYRALGLDLTSIPEVSVLSE
jgi:hypothetical protein